MQDVLKYVRLGVSNDSSHSLRTYLAVMAYRLYTADEAACEAGKEVIVRMISPEDDFFTSFKHAGSEKFAAL